MVCKNLFVGLVDLEEVMLVFVVVYFMWGVLKIMIWFFDEFVC